ncbi:hypothetical protein Tco_1054129 [Tanacetum coccineum]|uniref:Uncharacterized protein n=1 Tax=Tanacetum coccineum TaxID=301880 RepID=A0ABQ5GVW2_9ASTR
MKRTNRNCRIPIDLYPCRVEEKLIMRKSEVNWIMKKERRMILKDRQSLNFQDTHHLRKKRKKRMKKRRKKRKRKSYTASDNEVESNLESTARSEPKCKEMEDTCNGYLRKRQKSKPKRQNPEETEEQKELLKKSLKKLSKNARDDVLGLDMLAIQGNDFADTSKGCDGFKEAQDDLKGQD